MSDEPAIEGRPLSSGNTVFVKDVRILNPALDANPDECLVLGVPLPGIRRVAKMRAGKLEYEERPDIILCVISSRTFDPKLKTWEDKPDLFEATLEEFSLRGWFARVPVTDLNQRWEAAKIRAFLDGSSPPVNAYAVYQSILDQWRRYMDFDKNPRSDVFSALWTMGTYFFFLFNYYPYLKWGGTKGVGKSKAGRVGRGLCFNAEVFSGATESSIFRLASDARATEIIDEQEQLNDEQANAYIQILNSGFQADGAAIRTNKESMRVERWPSFSPKMICAILGLRETLEDRAIEIIVYMSAKPEIRSREPPGPDAEEWKAIRNDLYLLLFQQWKEVKAIYAGLENTYGYEARLWNITKPIYALARLVDASAPEGTPKLEDELSAFLGDVTRAKQAVAAGTNNARIAFALKRILSEKATLEPVSEDYRFRIGVKEVIDSGVKEEGEFFAEEFKGRNVAGILKNLHLYNAPKRQKGGFTFEVSMSDVKETLNRYGFETSEEKGEHGELDEHGERNSETPMHNEPDGGVSKTSSSHTPSSPSSPGSLIPPCGRCGGPRVVGKLFVKGKEKLCETCFREGAEA